MNDVANNLAAIRERISRAASHPVTLLGVTKKQSVDRIQAAVNAGLTHLGNNYVQEGDSLRQTIQGNVRWHFIGHIQSRKAKDLVPYDCVESVDRFEIARTLSERASAVSQRMSILIEVNIGAEATKSGVLPSALPDFLRLLRSLSGIEVSGLMCLPPPLMPVEERIPHFEQMAELYHRFAKDYPFTTLSMGTTEDFELAVKFGSNHIRIGTALFGARPVAVSE